MDSTHNIALRPLVTLLLIGVMLTSMMEAHSPGVTAGFSPSDATTVIPGNVLPIVKNGNATELLARGKIAAALTSGLNVQVFFSVQNQSALDAYVQDLHNPASGNFGKYLTPVEFGERFGPPNAIFQQTTSWLKDQGFTIDYLSPSMMMIAANASLPIVQTSFNVQISTYTYNGIGFFANNNDPSVPSQLAPYIVAIGGLNDYPLSFPLSHSTLRPEADSQPSGVVPDYVRNRYEVSTLISNHFDGTGQTVGIAAQGNARLDDVNQFLNHFGYTVPSITPIQVIQNSPPPTDDANAVEATLDVEWAAAMSPGASFKVYMLPTSYDRKYLFQKIADDNAVNMFSYSWGENEYLDTKASLATQISSLLQNFVEGISVFPASGDCGSYNESHDLFGNPICGSTLTVTYPASDLSVTAVGGTNLTGSPGSGFQETAWRLPDAGGFGTGGGKSILFSRPDYQSGTVTDQMRGIPDVAAVANHLFLYYSGSTSAAGGACTNSACWRNGWWGTSFAAPIWNGIYADIASSVAAGRLLINSRLPQSNYVLYNLGRLDYSSAFYDVTSGSNGAYNAGTGWDYTTGWGTPKAYDLAQAFLRDLPQPQITSISVPSSITYGQSITITVQASNIGGTANWQTINLAFPDAISSDPVVVATDLGSTNLEKAPAQVKGCYSQCTRPLQYPFEEGSSSSWANGVSHSLTVKVTPANQGQFDIYIKSVAGDKVTGTAISATPATAGGGTTDQQSEYVFIRSVQVGTSTTYSLQVQSTPNSVSISYSGSYSGSATTPFTIPSSPSSSSFSVTLTAPSSDGSGNQLSYWLVNNVNQGAGVRSIGVTVDNSHPSSFAVAVYQSPSTYVVHVISQPIQGISITCSGCTGGTTNFDVTGSGLTATLTAPSSFNGYSFSAWVWNGVGQGSSTSLAISVDSGHNGWYAIAEYSKPAYTTTWITALSTTYTTSVSITVTTSLSVTTAILGTVSTTSFVTASFPIMGIGSEVLTFTSLALMLVVIAGKGVSGPIEEATGIRRQTLRARRGLKAHLLRVGVILLLISAVPIAVPGFSNSSFRPNVPTGQWNFSINLCNSPSDCPSSTTTNKVLPTDKTYYTMRVTELSSPNDGTSIDVGIIPEPNPNGHPSCYGGTLTFHFNNSPSYPAQQDGSIYFSGAQTDCQGQPMPVGTYNFYIYGYWSYSAGSFHTTSNTMTLIVAWAGTITNTLYSAVTSVVPAVSTIVVQQTSTTYIVVTSVLISTLPKVTFHTTPTTFPGSSSVGSVSACGRILADGGSMQCSASFSATANLPSPSSGWQFDHWEWGGAVGCSSVGANPASCSASGAGSLTAVYGALVTFYTNPTSSAARIDWGSCGAISPGFGNSESTFSISYGSVTACYVPSGFTVSSWSCTGGLACSGSGDLTTVSVTGPGTITLNLKTGSLTSPVSTSLTASASPANPAHGTSFTVSGKLTENGVGLGGEQILLVFGWNSGVVAVTTQPDGSYSYTATAPATADSYQIQLFFLGDLGGSTQYLPSATNAAITVT